MLSIFFPPSFDSSRPIALIASRGRYPIISAAAIRAANVPLRLIALGGETEPELFSSFAPSDRIEVNVDQLGKLLSVLKNFDVGYTLMAGQIKPKKLFHRLTPDLKIEKTLLTLKRRNAETIFGVVMREIEDIGIVQLDARAFLDNQLASPGRMTSRKFPIGSEYLKYGIHIARKIAQLDIGQGCVVRKGTVLAVEAFEGTDRMLRRAGTFKVNDSLFVKTVKIKQDFRFDVSDFGFRTLETMQEAGLNAAALEAGKVIMLEKSLLLTKASELGIDLFGF